MSLDFPVDLPETMVVCGFPGASARFDKGWILLGVMDLSCENRFEVRSETEIRRNVRRVAVSVPSSSSRPVSSSSIRFKVSVELLLSDLREKW